MLASGSTGMGVPVNLALPLVSPQPERASASGPAGSVIAARRDSRVFFMLLFIR
jgi:hypothetical protein